MLLTDTLTTRTQRAELAAIESAALWRRISGGGYRGGVADRSTVLIGRGVDIGHLTRALTAQLADAPVLADVTKPSDLLVVDDPVDPTVQLAADGVRLMPDGSLFTANTKPNRKARRKRKRKSTKFYKAHPQFTPGGRKR